MKRLSPRQAALIPAGSITLVVFVILITLRSTSGTWGLLLVASLTLGVFIAAYILIIFALEKVILSKIKAIYSGISALKTPKKSGTRKGRFMKDDIIAELEKEVMELSNKQIKEIEALKEVAEYRKEFLGNVSHELKTPIFNIQGYLHTLIDGGMDDPEVNRRFLVKASENLERLSNIVNDLEVISQMEINALTLDFSLFNIVDLVDEVFNDLEMKAEQKGITLRFGATTNEEVVTVKADRESIRQVLLNLVSNSIRYGKQHGQTKVTVSEQGETILLDIADNGIGISESHLPRLFERFYRVDKSRSRELGGTGLGLSIVKHIVEAHGQSISVKSTPGKGSVFSFSLKKA